MDHKSDSDDAPLASFAKPNDKYGRNDIDDPELSEITAMFVAPVAENRADWGLDDEAGRAPDGRVTLESGDDEIFEPGFVLRDRFEIVELVHSGGMGHVYKAIDKRRHQGGSDRIHVAIKMMRRSLAPHLDACLALEREAAKTQHLSHPNIVNVYDFDQEDEQFYLVMEWLEGESVNALLRRTSGRRVAPQFAWQLIQGIAAGLQHAHSNNVVHADLNPSNIFVTDTQEIKLLDFGIARYASDPAHKTEGAPIWATRTYASPEVLSGSTPTFEDDVFSLACVGYRLLSGTHPFGGLSSIEAADAGMTVAPIPGLEEAYWQVLSSALSYARSDRPNSASAFFLEVPAEKKTGFAGRFLGKPLGPWLDAVPIVVIALLGGLWWLAQSSVQDESLTIPEASVPGGEAAVESGATNDQSELPVVLSRAAQAMDDERYVTPANDNARDMYREVLARDANNPMATGGLRSISDVYVQQANAALRAGAPTEASAALAIAGETDPDNPAIAIVNELLIAQGNGQLAKAQLAAAQGDLERAAVLLSDAERYAGVDAAAVAAVRSQLAASSAERQFLQALSMADVHIDAGRLLAPPGRNAHATLMDLQSEHQGDSRLQASMERLGERLLVRATAAAVANRAAEATELLDAAEILGVLAADVRTARQSLQRALEGRADAAAPINATETADPILATNEPSEVPVRSLADLGIEKFVTPRYPRNARRRGLVGFVDVKFKVHEDGSTGEIESVWAEPGEVFAASAENAVRQWQFAPRETPVVARVTLRFELDR